jgi:hypothetical protein
MKYISTFTLIFLLIVIVGNIKPHKFYIVMKILFLSLIAALLILLSCTKEDTGCEPGHLQTNIVGTWKVSVLDIPAGKIEFQANGDLMADPNILTNAYFGSDTLGQKSYVVNSDSSLTVTATNNGVVQTTELDVTDYTCDEINVETSGGVPMKLKRKD